MILQTRIKIVVIRNDNRVGSIEDWDICACKMWQICKCKIRVNCNADSYFSLIVINRCYFCKCNKWSH